MLEAMDRMLERVPSGRLQRFVSTLKVQRQEGGNLADRLQMIRREMGQS